MLQHFYYNVAMGNNTV